MLLNRPGSDPMGALSIDDLKELVRHEVQQAMLIGQAISTGKIPGTQREVFTVKEAADYARLSVSTIRAAIQKRQLVAQKIGRRVLVRRIDLERFLTGVWSDA